MITLRTTLQTESGTTPLEVDVDAGGSLGLTAIRFGDNIEAWISNKVLLSFARGVTNLLTSLKEGEENDKPSHSQVA